jgi:hypothetical protein
VHFGYCRGRLIDRITGYVHWQTEIGSAALKTPEFARKTKKKPIKYKGLKCSLPPEKLLSSIT